MFYSAECTMDTDRSDIEVSGAAIVTGPAMSAVPALACRAHAAQELCLTGAVDRRAAKDRSERSRPVVREACLWSAWARSPDQCS
jgi:hypothetical protein